jgi:hypothetical protein
LGLLLLLPLRPLLLLRKTHGYNRNEGNEGKYEKKFR